MQLFYLDDEIFQHQFFLEMVVNFPANKLKITVTQKVQLSNEHDNFFSFKSAYLHGKITEKRSCGELISLPFNARI